MPKLSFEGKIDRVLKALQNKPNQTVKELSKSTGLTLKETGDALFILCLKEQVKQREPTFEVRK